MLGVSREMSEEDPLTRGRASYARRIWTDTYAALADADRLASLEPQDLEYLATAAYLIGKHAESAAAWAHAHQGYLNRHEQARAARCAFWLAYGLFEHSERARGGAWIERGKHVLEEWGQDCVERGYMILPAAFECLRRGDMAAAYREFSRAAEIGDSFGDADLIALARHSRGRVLIRMGEIHKGVALLDEAMIAVEAGEVSPMVVGDVYCSVIEGCIEIFDFRRAQEWTSALSQWCTSQPDLIPYRGQCLLRRTEILQLRGLWPAAAEEVERACEHLESAGFPAAAAAFYQRGELHRLRGEFDDADAAYRQASRHGRGPQPGLALLRLAQGQLEAARASILRATSDARSPASRSRLLPAVVEISLAVSDTETARQAAGELGEIAQALDSDFLNAAAQQARGAVMLAEHDAHAAIAILRKAWTTWQELDIPYEAARTRVLLGFACRALGDPAAAEMEFDAARWVFERLGAAGDLAQIIALSSAEQSKPAGALSTRELQVLRLIAAGKTNRVIAAELFISERTVERHVSNIFIKLDVATRAAATAYAFQHQLV